MVRLQTLGTLDLTTAEGQPARSVLAQPKRMALLVYLAIENPGDFHRRDRLLALFWPDLDDKRARQSLRQATYVLRRSLGSSLLETRGDDELRIAPGSVWCDVVELRDRAAKGDAEGALELYRGDFLCGFYLDGSPDLEHWADSVREALRAEAAEAARGLADQALEAGSAVEAAHWSRRALEVAPYDEATLRTLVAGLVERGDRSAAVEAIASFGQRLRRDLAMEPAADPEALLDVTPPGAEPTPAEEQEELEVPSPGAPVGGSVDDSSDWRSPRTRRKALRLVVITLALWGAGSILWMISSGRPLSIRPTARVELDPDVIAVFPFRVRGAEAELSYLNEGMVELLSAVLSGENGPRAADPGAVLSQWRRAGAAETDLAREDALRIARGVGAGRALVGGIAGTPTQLLANAELLDTESGETLASASTAGIEDSLSHLVDELAAQLLAEQAGEPPYRLADLATRSPDALRAYLEGQAAYRLGHYPEAVNRYVRALEIDSTFALVVAPLVEAAGFAQIVGANGARIFRLGHAYRDRLSERDRLRLRVALGPNYPSPSSQSERLVAAVAAAVAAPDRPEAWYAVGDLRYHFGAVFDPDGQLEQARNSFRRALELDSLFAGAALHLLDLALVLGDTTEAAHLLDRQLASTPRSDPVDFMRWRMAHALGDTKEIEALRNGFPRMTAGSLVQIWLSSQEAVFEPVDAVLADEVEASRATTSVEQAHVLDRTRMVALNRGRLSDAAAASAAREEHVPGIGEPARRVLYALYWNADTTTVPEALARLDEIAAEAPGDDYRSRGDRLLAICIAAQWNAGRGFSEGPREALREMRLEVENDAYPPIEEAARFCISAVEALLPGPAGLPDAAAVDRFETLLRTGPDTWDQLSRPGALILAHLRERQGDLEGAAAAIRARASQIGASASYMSTLLREEGRLSELAGDVDGAIRAYRSYLSLRDDPEPTVWAEVERIRREIQRLEES